MVCFNSSFSCMVSASRLRLSWIVMNASYPHFPDLSRSKELLIGGNGTHGPFYRYCSVCSTPRRTSAAVASKVHVGYVAFSHFLRFLLLLAISWRGTL